MLYMLYMRNKVAVVGSKTVRRSKKCLRARSPSSLGSIDPYRLSASLIRNNATRINLFYLPFCYSSL